MAGAVAVAGGWKLNSWTPSTKQKEQSGRVCGLLISNPMPIGILPWVRKESPCNSGYCSSIPLWGLRYRFLVDEGNMPPQKYEDCERYFMAPTGNPCLEKWPNFSAKSRCLTGPSSWCHSSLLWHLAKVRKVQMLAWNHWTFLTFTLNHSSTA